MTLMSTGSGEVMSVSSILVYDIYKIYINPFRSVNPRGYTMFIQRRINVDATSRCYIGVYATLYKCHVPARTSLLITAYLLVCVCVCVYVRVRVRVRVCVCMCVFGDAKYGPFGSILVISRRCVNRYNKLRRNSPWEQ